MRTAEDDFADLDLSPKFQPLKTQESAERDEYKVAMTGPAAFMSPPPTKPSVDRSTAPSMAQLVASVETDSNAQQIDVADSGKGRKKLPIFAAVAASLACAAYLGSEKAATSRMAMALPTDGDAVQNPAAGSSSQVMPLSPQGSKSAPVVQQAITVPETTTRQAVFIPLHVACGLCGSIQHGGPQRIDQFRVEQCNTGHVQSANAPFLRERL